MIGRGAINHGPINYGAINGDRGIVLEMEASIDIVLSSAAEPNVRQGLSSLHTIGLDAETLLNLVMGLSVDVVISLDSAALLERTFFAKWFGGRHMIVHGQNRGMQVFKEDRTVSVPRDDVVFIPHEEREIA